jgi:hypothetical protein
MNKVKTNDVADKQAEYYSSLYKKHGTSIHAVASGEQTYKNLRYEKLSAVLNRDNNFTVHDIGCGLSHYYDFLKLNYPDKKIEYSGSDITPEFVEYSKKAHPECEYYLHDLSTTPSSERYDYVIYGGVFYHLAGSTSEEFEVFMKNILRNGFDSAKRGISFNFVTSYVDYKLDDLFYINLSSVIDFVASSLSRFFTIDHSTPLFEYTVCVYKKEYIKELYSEKVFDKYLR